MKVRELVCTYVFTLARVAARSEGVIHLYWKMSGDNKQAGTPFRRMHNPDAVFEVLKYPEVLISCHVHEQHCPSSLSSGPFSFLYTLSVRQILNRPSSSGVDVEICCVNGVYLHVSKGVAYNY